MSSTKYSALWLGGLAVAWLMADQPVPPELSTLAARARVEGPVTAWCRGEFRSGHAGAFAVAVSSPANGGRYLAIEPDATTHELAAFSRGADLACYSRAEAEKVSRTIEASATIQGQLVPRWPTTVVCGFTDNTTAVCWQYSPAEGRFVKVGGWIT